MKAILREEDIHKIVETCARRLVNEVRAGRVSRDKLYEAIDSYDLFNGMNETYDDDNEKNSHVGVDKKRQKIVQFLGKPTCDQAQYSYRLWPERSQTKKDKATTRSYFYKCLNREKDDNGNEYDFKNDDINRLYSMISKDGA